MAATLFIFGQTLMVCYIDMNRSIYGKAACMNLALTATVYLLEQDTDITDTIRILCNEKSLMLECFQADSALIEAVHNKAPACVIVANDKPYGQALGLLSSLNNEESTIPVIILGDHSDVASAVAGIKAGAIDYIEKPVIYGRLAEHFNQFTKQSAAVSMV